MPLYDYYCKSCKAEWEAFNSMANREEESCRCGTPATVQISATRTKPVIMDYFSENLNSHITGPEQRRRVMKESGVEEAG